MSENTDLVSTPDTDSSDAAEEKKYSGQKIMCFISKKMVPIEDTVEVDYAPGKSYRVLPKYIHAKA